MIYKKKKQIILLIFLISLFFIINYQFLDSALENFLNEKETIVVRRVIDGDTVIVGNKSVRLLGINSPEKGEIYYNEAKEFLEELVLNKSLTIEITGQDMYYRDLAYLFDGNKNINLELVEKGFANVYILDNKKYENDLRKEWENCVKNNNNLCEKSKDKCSDCIELRKFDYENEIMIFYNKCGFDCDLTGWTIKDEGRKKFIFKGFALGEGKSVKVIVSKAPQAYPETFPEEMSNRSKELFWEGQDYVWTNTGDTLFLRDSKGKLVLWRGY